MEERKKGSTHLNMEFFFGEIGHERKDFFDSGLSRRLGLTTEN